MENLLYLYTKKIINKKFQFIEPNFQTILYLKPIFFCVFLTILLVLYTFFYWVKLTYKIYNKL
jgi:hypothetical protein